MVRLGDDPFFRKQIFPWYDSDAACIVLFIILLPVLLFGFAGVSAALDVPEYRAHVWLPALLVFLTAGVMTSLFMRLVGRYARRRKRKAEEEGGG